MPVRRTLSIVLLATSVVGTGLTADPASATPGGGVSVNASAPTATQSAVGTPPVELNASDVATAIEIAATGSSYAFRIATVDGHLVGGGADGYAQPALSGRTEDAPELDVDTRISVQLPAVQKLAAKSRRKGAKTTRKLPAKLSATDLVRLAPSLKGGTGGTKNGWTTTAGQSDDGAAIWHSGEGTFPGHRETHACVATVAGHHLSIIFTSPIPGDLSPCRILLDATNA